MSFHSHFFIRRKYLVVHKKTEGELSSASRRCVKNAMLQVPWKKSEARSLNCLIFGTRSVYVNIIQFSTLTFWFSHPTHDKNYYRKILLWIWYKRGESLNNQISLSQVVERKVQKCLRFTFDQFWTQSTTFQNFSSCRHLNRFLSSNHCHHGKVCRSGIAGHCVDFSLIQFATLCTLVRMIMSTRGRNWWPYSLICIINIAA